MPAGTDGSVMLIDDDVVNTVFPVAAALTDADGDAPPCRPTNSATPKSPHPRIHRKTTPPTARPSPVPDTGIDTEFVPECVTFTAADSAPVTLGAYVTVIVVDAPGARLIGVDALKLAEKSVAFAPDTDALVIVIAGSDGPPKFVNCTDCGALDPTVVDGNVKLVGDAPNWFGVPDDTGRIWRALMLGFSIT